MLITIKYDNYLYWKYTPHANSMWGEQFRNLNSRYHLSKII